MKAKQSDREKELEAIVRALVPATRDVLWCALVWNDHNFDHRALLAKADSAAKALGYERGTIGSAVDKVNGWLERVERTLKSGAQQ